MGKIALVFPGQGAQYVGLANDIYNSDDIARKVIDEAQDSIGIQLKKIMFEGSDEELSKTENLPLIVGENDIIKVYYTSKTENIPNTSINKGKNLLIYLILLVILGIKKIVRW